MDKISFWGWYSDYDCHTIVDLKKYYNVKNVSMTKLVRITFKALKLILPAKTAEKIIRTALLSKIDKDSVVLFSDDILYYMNFALSLMNKRKIIVFRNIISPKYESDIQLLKKQALRCILLIHQMLAIIIFAIKGNICQFIMLAKLIPKRLLTFWG